MTETAEAAAAAGPAALRAGRPPVKKRRGTETVRDMVLSMAVLVVLVYVAHAVLSGADKVATIKTVDPLDELRVARSAATYPLVAATTLPDTWKPTSISTDTPKTGELSLHEGWVTPAGRYAALEETNGDSELFINAIGLKKAVPGPILTLGDRDWTELDGPDGMLSFSWLHDGAQVVVTGTAGQAELVTLMQDLSPDAF